MIVFVVGRGFGGFVILVVGIIVLGFVGISIYIRRRNRDGCSGDCGGGSGGRRNRNGSWVDNFGRVILVVVIFSF